MAGNKMKSKRAATKRFKITGGGKVKYKSAFRRHLLTKKSRNRKRGLRAPAYVAESDVHRITRLCPYG